MVCLRNCWSGLFAIHGRAVILTLLWRFLFIQNGSEREDIIRLLFWRNACLIILASRIVNRC